MFHRATQRRKTSLVRFLALSLAALLAVFFSGGALNRQSKRIKTEPVTTFKEGPTRPTFVGKPYEGSYLYYNPENGFYSRPNEKLVWCGDGNVTFPPRRRQLSQRVQMVYVYPTDGENLLGYDIGLSIADAAKDAQAYFAIFSLFDQWSPHKPLPGAKERVLRFNTGTNCGNDWLSIAAVQLPFNSQEAVGTRDAIDRTAEWTRRHLIEQGMSPYWNVMVFYGGPIPPGSPFDKQISGLGGPRSAYSIGHDAGGGFGITYCKYEPEKMKRAYAGTNERNTGRTAKEGLLPDALCGGGGATVVHELLHSYGVVYDDSPQSNGERHTYASNENNGYNCKDKNAVDIMDCGTFPENDIMGGGPLGDIGANSWFAPEVFIANYPYKESNLRYIIQNPTANIYYHSILCDVDKCAREAYGDATSPDSHDPGSNFSAPLLGAQYERIIRLGGLCNMFRAQQLCEKAFGPGVVVEDELGNVYPPGAEKALNKGSDRGGKPRALYLVRFAKNKRPPTLRLRRKRELVVRARPAASSCRALRRAQAINASVAKKSVRPLYLRAIAGRRTYRLTAKTRLTVGAVTRACKRRRPIALRLILPRAALKAKVVTIKDGGALLAKARR